MENILIQKDKKKINPKDGIKTFIVYFLFILVVFIGVCLNPFVSTFVAASSCVLVFFGPQKTIQVLSLFVLIRFFNPTLVIHASNLGVFSWGLLIISSIINIPWGLMNLVQKILPILLFSFFSVLCSVFVSGAVWITILKITSFLLGSMMVLSVFNRLNVSQIRDVILWFFALLSVIVIVSILTLGNHYIAYNLNGVGFQGIFNHPQTMGVFLAPFASFFVGRFMLNKKRIVTIEFFLFLILVFLILITQARTAALSVFLSFIITILIVSFPKIKAKIQSTGSFFAKITIGLVLLITVVITYQPAQDLVSSFIFKRESKNLDAALSSRSRGYSTQWDNFLKSPVIGNGFGVYVGSVPANNIQYFMGLPVSAAVEKGFLPTAILEEVGLAGMILFIYLLISLIKSVLKNNDPSWICMFFSSIFINLGECVFFAIGGMGIFYWLIIGLCTISYKKNLESE